jgi:hypothetical protein
VNGELPWFGILLMLAILAAMFGFPILTFGLDERRNRRAEELADISE